MCPVSPKCPFPQPEASSQMKIFERAATIISAMLVDHIQINGAVHAQYTCSVSCTACAHKSLSGMLSKVSVFLLPITALTEFVAPVTASSGNWIGHVRLALGSLPPMSCSPVEWTPVPCSQLSASVKAGPCGNQPARVGSSSHREDKHHSNLYYYSTYFAL